jgi:hypothetical protein
MIIQGPSIDIFWRVIDDKTIEDRIFARGIRYLLALPILFFALAVYGQRVASVAPFVSFDFGSPLFINRAPGVLDRFSSVDTGTSSAFSYGFGAEALLGSIGPIALIGRMEGIYSTGKFTGRDTISGQEWKLNAEAEIE